MARFGRGTRAPRRTPPPRNSSSGDTPINGRTTEQFGDAQRAYEQAMAQKAHEIDHIEYQQRLQLQRFAVETKWRASQTSYRRTRLALLIIGPVVLALVLFVGIAHMRNWTGATVIAFITATGLATLWRSNETRRTTLADAMSVAGVSSPQEAARTSSFTLDSSQIPRRW